MSKVKFNFCTVRSRVIPILKRIDIGEYPARIGLWYGWSRQHVFYFIKKLVQAQLIRRIKKSSATFYELTRRGQNFLRSCEGVVFGSGVFRLHKCQVKFRIVREGVYPLGSFREVEMVNWTALLGLESGVKVRKTTRNWIVHVHALMGRNPNELQSLALNLASRVAKSLMLKYGCLLGEPVLCDGYELALDDPVARLMSRYFTVTTKGRKMDHSRGKLEGEIDHLTRDSAVEYLLMPERIRKLESSVGVLNSQIEDLRGNIGDLVKVLNGALNGNNQPQPGPNKDGGNPFNV